MGNNENRSGGTSGPATSVIAKVKPKTKRPNLYRVLILNDDYTPMEFVVHVLEKFFQKDVEAATKIMLHVHHHGIGECGVFTYEIAETKVTQVMDFARKHQHPLQCVMEKVLHRNCDGPDERAPFPGERLIRRGACGWSENKKRCRGNRSFCRDWV
jgi:ATP-dependent Clp protease adaptor protein ClpS